MTSKDFHYLSWTVIGLCLLGSTAAFAQEAKPVNVSIATAQQQHMAPELEVPGTVVSRNDARISAEISGRLIYVAEIGTEINKGGVLAKTDDKLLQLQLRSNQAAIKRLDANINYQRQHVLRLEGLAANNNLAKSQLDEARAQLEMLDQDLAQAIITRDLTQYRIDRSKIRAPFKGRVVERLINPGEYANQGNAIARLTQTDQLEVRVLLPVNIKPFLKLDSVLQVRSNNKQIATTLRTIVPVADEVARTFEARVALPDSDWIVGAPVKVSVPNALPKGVVAVPRDALILRRNETYVIKVNNNNIADRVSVTTGSAIGDYIEVKGDVKAGDKVVIRGGEQLNTGQTVQISQINILETG